MIESRCLKKTWKVIQCNYLWELSRITFATGISKSTNKGSIERTLVCAGGTCVTVSEMSVEKRSTVTRSTKENQPYLLLLTNVLFLPFSSNCQLVRCDTHVSVSFTTIHHQKKCNSFSTQVLPPRLSFWQFERVSSNAPWVHVFFEKRGWRGKATKHSYKYC